MRCADSAVADEGAAVKKSKSSEQEAAGMQAPAGTMEQSTASTAGGASSATWLQVSFQVQGAGCSELGAAVVLKRTADKPECLQNAFPQEKPDPSKRSASIEMQQVSATDTDRQGAEGHDVNDQLKKEESCSFSDGMVVGFVTTAYKPELNGMSGGHACVRLPCTALSSDVLKGLHIMNPYAPGTFRKIALTEWRIML
jgi:hypothetical protein